MKILAAGAAALALVVLTSLSSAVADGPRASGGNTGTACLSRPAQIPSRPVRITSWQHHYAGHHPRWVEQWVSYANVCCHAGRLPAG